jgi:hypothetical protein
MKSTWATAAWASAVIVIAASTAYAQPTEVRLCAKTQNGQVRIVAGGATCLPSETSIDLVTGARGSFHLLDATDKDLGPYDLLTSLPGIFVARPDHDGQWVSIPVQRTTGPTQGGLTLYFSTPCPAGGTHVATDGRIPPPSNTDLLVRSGTLIGTTVYYAGDDFGAIAAASTETISATAHTCRNFTVPFSFTGSNVESVEAPEMTPPFRVVIR